MSDSLPQLGLDGHILEGIVTTRSIDDSVNISPMGPIVSDQFTHLILRPFTTSTTYQNLKRNGQGVFHVTDDVQLFAQAALGQPDPLPTLEGLILTDACRWYAFEIQTLDDSKQRAELVAQITDWGRQRDFFGFSRAKHAVLEAAILATRVELLESEEILAELARLEKPIRKTASRQEQQAYDFLKASIEGRLAESQPSRSHA